MWSHRLPIQTTSMTSQLIQTLLEPPSIESAQQKTLLLLNSRFQSLQDLDDLDIFERALTLRDDLKSQVRPYCLTWFSAQNSPNCRSLALRLTGPDQYPTFACTCFCDRALTNCTRFIPTSTLTRRWVILSIPGTCIIYVGRWRG